METFPANHYSITAMRGEELRKFLREKTNAELVDLTNDALSEGLDNYSKLSETGCTLHDKLIKVIEVTVEIYNTHKKGEEEYHEREREERKRRHDAFCNKLMSPGVTQQPIMNDSETQDDSMDRLLQMGEAPLRGEAPPLPPVSYTHLTLPTICSV